jgi:hypothetical protein
MNSDLKRSYSTTSDAYFNFHPRLAVEERHAHYRQTRREARSPQDLNEPHCTGNLFQPGSDPHVA